jgi:hypothetical protein
MTEACRRRLWGGFQLPLLRKSTRPCENTVFGGDKVLSEFSELAIRFEKDLSNAVTLANVLDLIGAALRRGF